MTDNNINKRSLDCACNFQSRDPGGLSASQSSPEHHRRIPSVYPSRLFVSGRLGTQGPSAQEEQKRQGEEEAGEEEDQEEEEEEQEDEEETDKKTETKKNNSKQTKAMTKAWSSVRGRKTKLILHSKTCFMLSLESGTKTRGR